MLVTVKEFHVFSPVLILVIMGAGVLTLYELRIPPLAAMLALEALASVWVYKDSKVLSEKYPDEWKDAELGSPFWLGVTALIFAPIGLPLYTYELKSLNNALKRAEAV